MARDLDRGFRALRGLLERDLEVVAEVRAALRAAAPPAAAGAEQVAETEHVAEDVGEVAELREDRRVESGRPAAGAGDAGMAEAIIRGALLGVGEDGVRFRALLELFFREIIARVAIRMMFHREPAIRTLDFGVARGLGDLEHLVVVALAHALATFTMAGRSRRSFSM